MGWSTARRCPSHPALLPAFLLCSGEREGDFAACDVAFQPPFTSPAQDTLHSGSFMGPGAKISDWSLCGTPGVLSFTKAGGYGQSWTEGAMGPRKGTQRGGLILNPSA